MADADALLEPGVTGLPGTSGLPATPEPGTPPPPAAAPPSDESVMSLVDHLGELRTRLFRSIIAVALASVIGFLAAPDVRKFLQLPLGDIPLQVLGVGD